MGKTLITLSALCFILFFASVLFVDFLPSWWGGYASQRLLLSLFMVIFLALAFLRLLYRGIWVSSLPGSLSFLLVLLSFIAGVFYDFTQPFHFIEPIFYSIFFLAFGVFGYLIRAEGARYELACGLAFVAVVACFFYAAMTITVYLFAIKDQFSHLDSLIPWGFVNIRYWSHVATWLIPLLPLGLLVPPCKDNRLWRIGMAFTGAIWWWILFMSSSRGSLVGLFIGLFLTSLIFGRAALPWVRPFIKFAIYGLIAWCLLSVAIPSLLFEDIQVRGIKDHSSGRIPLWQEAWAMSLQNFPFGMGPQSWLTHGVLTEAYQSSPKFGHPHNMYLMWAAEYGWICVFGILILGMVAARRVWQRAAAIRLQDSREALLLVAFTSSVTGAIVHAGASAVFIAPGSMLVGLTVLSVFWALASPDLQPMASKKQLFKGSALAGWLILIMFIFAGSLWFREVLRYHQAMTKDLVYYQENVPQGTLPRFWFHGNFPRHSSEMPSGK